MLCMDRQPHQKLHQSNHSPVHDAPLSRLSRHRPLRPVLSAPQRGSCQAEPATKSTRRTPKCVPLACDNCRLRKAKCSGSQPCLRCLASQVDCVFTGRALDQLRRKVKELETVLAKIFDTLRVSDASSIEFVLQVAAKSVSLQEFVHQVSQHCVKACQDTPTSSKQCLLAEATHRSLSSYEDVAAYSPLLRGTCVSMSSPDNKSPSSTGISEESMEAEFKVGWQGCRKDPPSSSPLENGRLPTKCSRIFTDRLESESVPLNESDFEMAPLPSPISIASSHFPTYMLDPQLPTFGCPTNLVQPIRLVMADNHSSDPCHILGQAQGKFAAKGRQLIMQLGTEFVLGAPTLDVPGLLEPLDITINDATDVQTFSKIYMFQFQNVKTADRIALTYLLILFMRWLVLPCQETYEDMPWWLRPTAAEDVPQDVSGDFSTLWNDFHEFTIAQPSKLIMTFAATTSVNWPCPDDDIIWFDDNAGRDVISPIFCSHLLELNNWTQ